jgi:hypothetical protein
VVSIAKIRGCDHGGEKSYQPSLVAFSRPAPRRPELVSDGPDVGRRTTTCWGLVRARASTRRWLRENVARGSRHTSRQGLTGLNLRRRKSRPVG